MQTVFTYEDYKELIDRVFRVYGDKNAITCVEEKDNHRKITYGRLQEIVNAMITGLQNMGIQRAQRVAVVLPSSAQAVVVNLALAYGGYTGVLIDAALPCTQRDKLLEYADVNAVFTTQDIYNQMDEVLKQDIPAMELTDDFACRVLDGSPAECVRESIEPGDEEVIAIVFSSGTTSEMKGCMVTYNSIIYAQKYMLQYTNLDSKATFLDVLPSNHIAGYSSAMSCFLTGTEMGFISEMSAEKLSAGFLNYNPTNFIMIPKVYEVIMNKIMAVIERKPFPVKWYALTAMKICGLVREKTGIKLRFLTKPVWKAALGQNMKICGCGTLPCSEDIIRFYLNLGIDFVNVYGATETGFPISAANCNDRYPTKGAGNIKQFREVRVMIADPDAEGVGEIRVKTPLAMKGYFKEPELTARAFDEEGYFKTGDLGYIDAQGNLYITGRSKEAIVLRNGKKASPIDVDHYYRKGARGLTYASCGIPSPEGYDQIYLFVEKGDHPDAEVKRAIRDLTKISETASIYKAERILAIDKIPVTAVGKVKRFLLKKYAEELPLEEGAEEQRDDTGEESREEFLIRIIEKYAPGKTVTMESELKTELGIDSLSMFELGIEIESCLGIDVVNYWGRIEKVKDILYGSENGDEKNYDISEFPLKRKAGDMGYIKAFGRLARFLYRLEADGIANIPRDENVMFCPNHESYPDAMWVAAALLREGYDVNGFCCLAAEHLKDKAFMKRAFRALGGIPVDRSGNTVPAMKRAAELLRQEGICMLIHPEGTRSRSGELGEFKLGAAELAKETGVKIVPVCIDGAYEIYPPNVKIPHCFNWRKCRPYRLKMSFGEAIDVRELSKEEITDRIKTFIVEKKAEK